MASRSGLRRGVARERGCTRHKQECPLRSHPLRRGDRMQVIIGVDPHKASHTAVAIDSSEVELASKKIRASRAQVEQLLDWASPFPARLWAVEGAEGMGYLLAQQLVASGEHVCNVPATLAARARVLGTGRSNKNDPNDARSVAIAALRTPGLRQVER